MSPVPLIHLDYWRWCSHLAVLCYVFYYLQEKICEDSSSFDLTSADIANAISELNQVLEKLQSMHVDEDGASYDTEAGPGMTDNCTVCF